MPMDRVTARPYYKFYFTSKAGLAFQRSKSNRLDGNTPLFKGYAVKSNLSGESGEFPNCKWENCQ